MTTRFLVIGGAESISSHYVRTLCSNNYRHHQYPEKKIPLFVTNLLDGRTVPLHGDGGNIRDWLHVGDHVRGIELVRTGGRLGETCIVGGGVELTNRELTELDLRACGCEWDDSVTCVGTTRAMAAATRWPARRSARSWATGPASRLPAGWPRRSPGGVPVATGGSR